MNCVDIRIVEAWERGKNYRNGLDWQRRSDIEALSIESDWMSDWTRQRLGLDG